MEKLYYARPYVKEFEAKVVSCRQSWKDSQQYEVILDRTGFYPEGGGQPADTGVLLPDNVGFGENGRERAKECKQAENAGTESKGCVAVLDVHERADGIVHTTDGPLKEGSLVRGQIDWQRRFDHMQNHSGEHILSGLVHREYGYDNVGFHMGKDEVTVDFNGILTMEQAERIEQEVNEMVTADLPVQELFPSQEELETLDYRSKRKLTGQVRIIRILGADVCACCGTHVMTTGEIGMVKVTGLIRYKGGVRLSMVCGRKALFDYEKKQAQLSAISVMLSAKPDLVSEAVARCKEESGKKDALINQLYQELFAARMELYADSDKPLLLLERDLAPAQLRRFATLLYENGKGSVVLVCSGQEGAYQYAMGSSSRDMGILSRQMNTRLNGRGGGSACLAQGTFQADWAEIQSAFSEI